MKTRNLLMGKSKKTFCERLKEHCDPKAKTEVWAFVERKYKEVLGYVKWNHGRRQYCFYPLTFGGLSYNGVFLKDIAIIVQFINTRHRRKRCVKLRNRQ